MSNLDEEKIERCKNVLLKEYFDTSIVEVAVSATDYVEKAHGNLEFLKFGKWVYIPREWFTDPSILPDFAFSEMGRQLAIGEEKYIVKQILENKEITTKHLDTLDYESVAKSFTELRGLTDTPILFAPITYYVPIHIDWSKQQDRLVMEKNDLIVAGNRVRVFWSSKYVDFDKFIVARRTFGRWIAKPAIKDRVSVEIKESKEKPDKMELKIETVFNFMILSPNQVEVLQTRSVRA